MTFPPTPVLPAPEAGTTLAPCPHCFLRYGDLLASPGRECGRRYLHPDVARNPMSRRDGQYICHDCQKAEVIADVLMPGPEHGRSYTEQLSTDNMMRTVVYSDRCEGRRLPPGIPWGPSQTITTGAIHGGEPDPYDDFCGECGGIFAFGFLCTDCNTVRPALEALRSHPALIERERAEAEAEERERQWRIEQARRIKISKEVDEYVGYSRNNLCANCGSEEQMRTDDYICLRCRANTDLVGNPLFQHVLYRLDQLGGRG